MQPLQKNFWQEDETTRQVRWYIATGQRPWFWGVGGLVFIYLLSLVSFLEWSSVLLAQIGWGILAAAVLWSVIRVAATKRIEYIHAFTTGVLGGVALGLVHAVLQLVWFRSGWLLFNLIAEPLFVAVGGALGGIIVVWVWQQIDRWQERAAPARGVPVSPTPTPVELPDTPAEIILPPVAAIPTEETSAPVGEIELVTVVTTPTVAESATMPSPAPESAPAVSQPAAPAVNSPVKRKKNTKSLVRPRYARPSTKQKPSPDQPSVEETNHQPAAAVKRRRRAIE